MYFPEPFTPIPLDFAAAIGKQSFDTSIDRQLYCMLTPKQFQGVITINDATKDQVRHSLLALATSGDQERKIVSASSLVVSKIASVDFPDQWPSLLPTLLHSIPQSHEGQLHGGLVVLGNLVEDGFDEEQFGKSAIELVRCIYDIATDERKKLNSRALAVSIFRACFDTMELMYQTDKASVKQFMQEASDAWTPFFINVLKLPLPPIPAEEQEGDTESGSWRGTVALKTQVVKVGAEQSWILGLTMLICISRHWTKSTEHSHIC